MPMEHLLSRSIPKSASHKAGRAALEEQTCTVVLMHVNSDTARQVWGFHPRDGRIPAKDRQHTERKLTRTVSSSAWILGSVRTSSSRRTFDSETETFRRCGCCCGDILWVSARQKRATHPKHNNPKPKHSKLSQRSPALPK